MRIAFITQSYPPMISGAAIVVERLAQGMAERGHAVLVLAASDRGQAYTEQIGNVRLVRLASLPNPKRANQHFVPIAFRSIAQELESFEPDILHIHDMVYLGVIGIAVARSKRCPVIGTVHALPGFISAYLPGCPRLKRSLERSLWSYSRWVNKQCDAIVAPTPTIAHTIQSETGFRTMDISNGVDLVHFCPEPAQSAEKEHLCQKYKLDPSRPIVLHVGRLDVDKKVEQVIDAAAKLPRATNAQLLVVGDGECGESLQALTHQLGITERCRFPGFVTADGDLPGIYRMADVFTTASQIETQGLVLLEAMASGLPVVAVEATCIPELVKENVTGYLVPPNDVDALANGLIRLIENPAQAKKMGRRGRELVRKHALEHSLDQHENLYKKHILLRQSTHKQQAVRAERERLWRFTQ